MFNMFASAGPGDRLGCSLPASSHQPITRQLCCFFLLQARCVPASLQTRDHSRESMPDPHHTSPHSGIIARPPGDNHRFGSEVLARHRDYHRACELFSGETERAFAKTLDRPNRREEKGKTSDRSGFAVLRVPLHEG